MKKQEIYVSCVEPENGSPSVAAMVFGQEEDLAKTFVVFCSGGNPIECRPVEILEVRWGNLPVQKVGYVRIFVDPSYLNCEMSVYSVIKTSDDTAKSKSFRFRM
ncbi:MAG TPA: hypothetical protein PKL88_01500 [bacterium]|nr:hypothetical protein [bacterium]